MVGVGSQSKNTIEFRIPNGSIDPQIWIENINLFGGIVATAEQLTQIQKKSPQMRTEEETNKLNVFNRLCNQKLSEEEQLSSLLTLAVSDDKRKTYEDRYQSNSVLMKKSSLNADIDNNISKKPINPYIIGKALFTGQKLITGQEMQSAELRLERDMQIYRNGTDIDQTQDIDLRA